MNITQGTNTDDRIGDRVLLHRVSAKIHVRATSNGTFSGQSESGRMRFGLLVVKHPTSPGVAPTTTDIFDDDGGNNPEPTTQYRNLSQYRNYKMIFDKIYHVNTPVNNTGGLNAANQMDYRYHQSFQLNINHRFKRPLMVKWTKDGGGADVIDNHVLFFARSDYLNTTNTPGIQIEVRTRIVYSDA